MIMDQMKKHVQSYFNEAKWFKENYIPTLEEYMQHALVSCGYCMLSITSFVGMGDIATEKDFEWFSKYPKIIRGASAICRLMDDVVGHKVPIRGKLKNPNTANIA